MGGETKTNLPSAGRDEDEELVHWFEKKRDVISKLSEKSHDRS